MQILRVVNGLQFPSRGNNHKSNKEAFLDLTIAKEMERMIFFLVAKTTMILAEDECLAAALRDGDIYFDSANMSSDNTAPRYHVLFLPLQLYQDVCIRGGFLSYINEDNTKGDDNSLKSLK